MLSFISAKDAAEKWNISQRRVSVLCSENRIDGAMMVGNMWIIPSTAEKPIDKRTVKKQKEQDLEIIIKDEKLKHDEAQKFIENSFRDGGIKTTGTDIDKILPPISRFSDGSNRALKKQTVIDKLKGFFEKYFGLV